ncbi:MAG: hypothetical protein GKR94_15080 [Gammaproteobacteria bacterium]|nr:hypothetical protein [Gammaproteobacteria bacterium]
MALRRGNVRRVRGWYYSLSGCLWTNGSRESIPPQGFTQSEASREKRPVPCGSGKPYKNCCRHKSEAQRPT